jgi:hypothetical protein
MSLLTLLPASQADRLVFAGRVLLTTGVIEFALRLLVESAAAANLRQSFWDELGFMGRGYSTIALILLVTAALVVSGAPQRETRASLIVIAVLGSAISALTIYSLVWLPIRVGGGLADIPAIVAASTLEPLMAAVLALGAVYLSVSRLRTPRSNESAEPV